MPFRLEVDLPASALLVADLIGDEETLRDDDPFLAVDRLLVGGEETRGQGGEELAVRQEAETHLPAIPAIVLGTVQTLQIGGGAGAREAEGIAIRPSGAQSFEIASEDELFLI